MSLTPKKHDETVVKLANKRQSQAADPSQSVWVNASAGTGKTKVLTDRVLRLLLPGQNREQTEPDRIVCITFTKAAATEMANRVQSVLSKWTQHSEKDLLSSLASLTGETVTPEMMTVARQLFARVVDVPGGMKIMTIHAFCQSVLKRFPLEAGLRPDFLVSEERQSANLLRQAMDDVLYFSREEQGNAFFTQSVEKLSTLLDEDRFQHLMESFIYDRQMFSRFLKNADSLDQAIEMIYQKLDLDPKNDVQTILKQFTQTMDLSQWQTVYRILQEGAKTENDLACKLKPFIETPDDATWDHFKDFFLTQNGQPRSRFFNKKNLDSYPVETDIINKAQDQFVMFLDQMNAVQIAEATSAFLTIGSVVLERYQGLKNQRGLMDYDDLIDHTVTLLTDREQTDWILYKLDGGIDHILIDEAQDTSPQQWRIIQSLTEEFFSGEGKQDSGERTLFVVGDEKQSIYSFQKADPYEFIRMRDYFSQKIGAAHRQFEQVSLQTSFRSTRSVLEFVDHVFSNSTIRWGVSLDKDQTIQHEIFRLGQAGHIEIWPLAKAQTTEEREPWSLPVQREKIQDAETVLARQMASTISEWFSEKTILPSKNRPIQPDDIMILLRTRGQLMTKIIQELKRHHVPVAGADRLALTEDISVMDLLAVADFVLLPTDDLTLATILKSPLIGLQDDDLLRLTKENSGYLWDALSQDQKYKEAYDYLSHLVTERRFLRPYEFFSFLLFSPCPADDVSGKRAMISRLGQECLDPIFELLTLSLQYEQDHIPDLQTFLHWIEQETIEVKRDTDHGVSNKVQIMTVHGSKGLQAPIVFLADAANYPSATNIRLLWSQEADSIPLWSPLVQMENNTFKTLKENHKINVDSEYRRLLYVALTRAEDQLYITGKTDKKGSVILESWYGVLSSMIKEHKNVKTMPWTGQEGWHSDYALVLEHYQDGASQERTSETETAQVKKTVPSFFYDQTKSEKKSLKPLAPSRQSNDDNHVISPLDRGDNQGLRPFTRGIMIHKILQFLPDLPKESRQQACLDFLKRQKNLEGSDHDQLTNDILAVIHHPDFSQVFDKSSQAEVPVTGVVTLPQQKDPVVVSGQIDRLVVLEEKVLIVDYKTNRLAVEDIKDVPKSYWRQMALYRRLIQDIYPDKVIECALLWTESPYLMILPSERLDDILTSA